MVEFRTGSRISTGAHSACACAKAHAAAIAAMKRGKSIAKGI